MPNISYPIVLERKVYWDLAARVMRIEQISTLMVGSFVALALPGCSGCEQIVKDVPRSAPVESDVRHSDDSSQDQPKKEPPRESVTVPSRTEDKPGVDGARQGSSGASPATKPLSVSSKDGSAHSSPSSRKSVTPDAAFSAAVALREKASNAAGRKNYGSAFDYASQAWETAAAWPNDARLQKLAEELATELKQLGAQANAKASAGASDANKKLIDR